MEEDSTPQNKQTTNIKTYLPPTDDPLNEFPERGVTQGPPLRKKNVSICASSSSSSARRIFPTSQSPIPTHPSKVKIVSSPEQS